MRKSITLPAFIQAFAVLYLIVWSISPPLEIDLIYRLLALGLAALWAVIALFRRIQFDTIHIWALLFIVAVAVIAYFERGSFSDIIKQISFYMLFVEFVIFSFYYQKDLWHELEWIVPLLFLLLIFFNYKTVTALIEDPTLARLIVRNDENIYQYMRQGIGGYALVYAQCLFFPAGLMWTMKAFRQSKLKFAIGAVWFVSYILLIANAGYSIAIFTTVASVLVLFFYKGRSVVGVIILAVLLFVGTMMAILYSAPFREWLLSMFDGTAVAKKINDLVASSESGAAEGSILSRVTAYRASLKALITYPIIGSVFKNSGAGSHSAVLDNIAKYGWWGGFVYVKLLFNAPLVYKKDFNNAMIRSLSNAQLVVMIFVSVFDTLPYQLMCSFLLIVPLLTQDILKWTGEKDESSLVG